VARGIVTAADVMSADPRQPVRSWDAVITRPFALGPEFDMLPNDTEETLMGSSLHQAAIVALYTSLQQCGPRRGLPWFVGNQIKLIIPRHGRGSYQPSPDILVHPTLTSGTRESIHVTADGPPTLIIEVASPATVFERDVNLTSPDGKPGVYAAIGVREYLVFDPTGDILGEPVWARRVGPRRICPLGARWLWTLVQRNARDRL
jgi:hypothetical protein